MKKLIAFAFLLLTVTACERPADVASRNLSQAADYDGGSSSGGGDSGGF